MWSELVPPEGFFAEYLRYARKLTDAPDLFHVGTALAMFATAAARVAVLVGPDGKSPQPLHLWVLLLGPSGERKSTAINIGLRAFRSVPEINPMAVSGSPEGTFNMIAKEPHGLFMYPEASDFFKVLNGRKWLGTAELFPSLFDGKTLTRALVGRRTKQNPHPAPIRITIKNPRICFLGGASPTMLPRTISERDLTGGLLGRVLPLYAECTRYDPAPPREGSARVEARLQLLYRRAVVENWSGSGRVVLDRFAWMAYKAWVRQTLYEAGNLADDKRGIAVRITGHVLRVAALYRMATPETTNDTAVMHAAMAVGEEAKKSILKLPPIL